MREKVSVVITMYNVEDIIADCLESVIWADEIIAMDSFSTDRTPEIARKYTDKVIQHEFEGYAAQKNRAVEKASHPWILVLDSDEQVTPEIKDTILETLNSTIRYNAYRIPRQNYFLGKKVHFSGWQHDVVTRFFRKGHGKFSETHVHEDLVVEDKVGALRGALIHHSCRSLSQFLEKVHRYSFLSAQDRAEKMKKVQWYHLTLRPIFRFFKQYFLKLGFLDGMTGLVLCSLAAYSVFLKYAQLWELQKRAKTEE